MNIASIISRIPFLVPKKSNTGVEHGKWGEDIAAKKLEREGFAILERNARPCKSDRRLEIDIIALDKLNNTVVFVEVKQHKSHWAYESSIRGVDRRKKKNLRTACNAWRRMHDWQGGYRFDVVEVFGTPESGRPPEIKHVERVNLFAQKDKFVPWI